LAVAIVILGVVAIAVSEGEGILPVLVGMAVLVASLFFWFLGSRRVIREIAVTVQGA
jgi:hypothetical protein